MKTTESVNERKWDPEADEIVFLLQFTFSTPVSFTSLDAVRSKVELLGKKKEEKNR